MNYDSPKSLCWSVGTVLRQAIFETELERGIERNLWWKIEKTKGEGNVAEKKRKKKEIKKRVLCWLWLTEVTLLKKCGYRVKASNIWNGVRYWKKFVEENWENGEIKKIKGKWHVAEKKRKKKEIKKRVTSGGVIVDILDIVEADLRGVSVDNLCLGISVIA